MLAWLGVQVITFQTPQADGVLVRRGDDAVAWVVGAMPRSVEGPYDPSEQTLTLRGRDLDLRLVGDVEWSGRLTWRESMASTPDPPAGRR